MTVRLTVGQALVRFLANQYTERDGVRRRLVAGCFGIFGHGNVAGVGQALAQGEEQAEEQLDALADECVDAVAGGREDRQDAGRLRYYLARNEQAMVHTAVGYARMHNRLSTFACTTSIGPGATNLVTGAALATINRIPVLLLPGDVFATRVADPVLQQLEALGAGDVSVNDCLRPVSRYFDRIWRPEMLVPAALRAMAVLTDPAETGAVTLALPQDVQTEAYDFPAQFLRPRVWPVRRPAPDPTALAAVAELLRGARRPLVVAGGGVIYSEATEALRRFVEATGVPVAETQAGKGALPFDHPCSVGAIGVTGTTAANALARDADVVLGVGTRWSDFTTASHTVFAHPEVRFANLNVTAADAHKHAGLALVADARAGLADLSRALTGWRTPTEYSDHARDLAAGWQRVVDAAYHPDHPDHPDCADSARRPAQTEVLGAVNEVAGPRDVVVNAAGSMPGELHRLWRSRDPKSYHVEYGYSCMGYEIAGGLGVKLADPTREVFVLVGDGSYLMMAQELVTAVSEGVKLVVVVVQNHGFASIGALSESVGAQRFGTSYRFRSPASGRLDGDLLPVDLAANAESLGARVLRAGTLAELRAALTAAVASAHTTVVHVETDATVGPPDSGAWWDVPVAQVADLESTRAARVRYERNRQARRDYL